MVFHILVFDSLDKSSYKNSLRSSYLSFYIIEIKYIGTTDDKITSIA